MSVGMNLSSRTFRGYKLLQYTEHYSYEIIELYNYFCVRFKMYCMKYNNDFSVDEVCML